MASATFETSISALDTSVRLVTPERITFQYPLAGPFRRAAAYLIDLLVMLILTILGLLVAMTLALGTEAGIGLFLAFLFALRFGYGALFEGLNNGQTPGKRALSLRVVSTEGVPITGAQAFLRNLLWAFDGAWPFCYLPAVACMMLTRRFQRLGDLAAGTMVVVEQRPGQSRLVRFEENALENVLLWLPARIDAGPELARTLSDYVKRRKRFSAPRREEMAGHLAQPLRQRQGIPDEISNDAIVCALYHRVFLGD